jgi:DNA mismatch endonuclease (patch repair protein)
MRAESKYRSPRRADIQQTDLLRRQIMQLNKSHGNRSTELRLIELMRAHKISGWRRGVELNGRPDFVFLKYHLVVFVDGCFWHGCHCKRTPVRNKSFWISKFQRNRLRDRHVSTNLRREGWSVLRIREHDLKKRPHTVMNKIAVAMNLSARISGPKGIRL